MTPNQVIARQMKLARLRNGWTQEQAAEALRNYGGLNWSKAVYATAECSVAGNRVRHFTADDIVAIVETFGVSVAWLFGHTNADGDTFTVYVNGVAVAS